MKENEFEARYDFPKMQVTFTYTADNDDEADGRCILPSKDIHALMQVLRKNLKRKSLRFASKKCSMRQESTQST